MERYSNRGAGAAGTFIRPLHEIPAPRVLTQIHNPRRLKPNAELSIFNADRYFSDISNKKSIITRQSCDLSTNPRDSSVSSVDTFTRNYRSTSFRATPTASSEASWNSHTGLLPKPPASAAITVKAFPLNELTKPAPLPTPRWRFPRHCPCSGKKSIDVEEKYSETKSPAVAPTAPQENWTKERERFQPSARFSQEPRFSSRRVLDSGGFSFPVLKSPVSNTFPLPDPARHSLEVFKPSRMGYPFPASHLEDDAGSDASSDLFEIESFSKRRDSVDGLAAGRLAQIRRSIEKAAAVDPSEGYAPSEASVEWSVTTAEGFDRSSVANFSTAGSDYEPARFDRTGEQDRTAGKRRGNGLLSCVCEKAVNVGPKSEQRGRPELDRVREIARLVRSNSARICRPLGTRLG
ncbi:hypothetical protein J5N97_013553 [Dioscorea zingiberensis]|uniref:Uncharacterized protein n=1 Tax=Dioscorea zingiberensis TaxID=325984 RepID=A0A9D5HIX8_9LILI|nr:hypothetical protein J5N97_013553 [Dioscorea zingiberensis]